MVDMRKVLTLPLALAMSMSMLIVLVMGGNGLNAAHALPTGAARALSRFDARVRALCAPQPVVCGQAMAGAGGTLLLIAATRFRDSLALFAPSAKADDAATDDQAAPAPHTVTPALTSTLPAAEALALLAFCAWLLGLDARRRFAAFRRAEAFPLLLRRLTEHRIAPAP
jgi:hypothetical protein